MNKIDAMQLKLSESALERLSLTGRDYIGAVVQIDDEAVMTELRVHGVIGEDDGLTVLGSALAGRLQAQALEAMFG